MKATQAYLGAFRVLDANAKPGDRIGIIGSVDVDMEFYQTFLAVAPIVGAEATVALMLPRYAPGNPAPPELEEYVKACDLVILAATTSLSHSSTAVKVLEAGKKLYAFPVPKGARALEVLASQGVYTKEKLAVVKDNSLKVKEIWDKGHRIHVTCKNGSKFSCDITGRIVHPFYGTCENNSISRNYSSAPPGDAHLACIEDSAEGVLFIDGYISGVGMPASPVRLKMEKGKVVDISGGLEAKQLQRLMDSAGESGFVVSEAGLGTSPYEPIVNWNGDKKATGTFHIAVGRNKSPCFGGLETDGKNESSIHLDMLILAPVRVDIDGKVMVDQGKLLV